MPYVSAIAQLVADVQALATAEANDVSIVYGAREPHRTTNQGPGRANRIVFAPGDDKDKAGTYSKARYPGRNPRSLATLAETFRVYVWAFDPSAPRDELKQDEACRAIHEWAVRAIYLKAHGTYALKDPQWVRGPLDAARLGSELFFLLELQLPIFDTPYQTTSLDPPPTGVLESEIGFLNGSNEPGC